MTCVVGITDGDKITLGADSAIGQGDEIYAFDSMRKIFAHGPYLLGFCGLARVGQILRFQADLPEPAAAAELEPFIVRELVPAIRQAVTSEGVEGPGRLILGERTTLLLGCQGQLWSIGADLMAVRETSFAAIGSGRLRAYGALYALDKAGLESDQRRLELALEAAAAYTSTVRPPWHFISSASAPTA